MVARDRDMEIIALLSNDMEGYTYVDCKDVVIDHVCEKTNEATKMELYELEYFKGGKYKEDRANFCEHCKKVFVYKP